MDGKKAASSWIGRKDTPEHQNVFFDRGNRYIVHW
jgi:hypothetical protein